MTGVLGDRERVEWLALARAPKIGPVSFFQLLDKFGSPVEAAKSVPQLKLDYQAAEQEIDMCRRAGGQIVCACEENYPPALSALSPPPPVLSMIGDHGLLKRPAIGIVGARNASAAGRKLARLIAAGVGAAGLVSVSGLARGIDGEAHAASLETGTIAVLAGGVDQVYPPQHQDLYSAIAEKGLIVSERRFGHRATARDFPRRNRIITGLSVGTVIVEAAERSGSLISARMAGEQGREVMAVPGSPLDARAAGTNRLLRNGATLVRHADDVIEAVSAQIARQDDLFAFQPTAKGAHTVPDIPEGLAGRVYESLSPTPVAIEEIALASACSARQCASVLLELELEGRAITHAGGLASRT
ncbi:DNA-processing protein DprA [Henriciella sp. AS95]|uniref:DNA-processing protein DprA n=1 Tax=Henriciella sp. AS95 TaxID=3135782 RepID=UPI00316D90B1